MKDARWLRKREALYEARGNRCQLCGDHRNRLTIHHGYYNFDAYPWEYEDESLWVLCWPCHETTQYKLAEIHRIIGRKHPSEMESVRKTIESGLFEMEFGVSLDEAAQVLKEELEAEKALYCDYQISIVSSSELGPSKAHEMESNAVQRFPGIQVGISMVRAERDTVSTVNGPDPEVVSRIQSWCDRWAG